MTSPFPGMDPYLEDRWRDVHASLVLYARNQLQPQLGDSLRARVEERVVVESSDEVGEHGIYPDVRIVERPRAQRAVSPNAGAVAMAEPLIIRRLEEEHSEGYVQIIDVANGNRVVTVLEILNSTNKRKGEAREQHTQKQRELRQGGVSLVEIDLLRGGKRLMQVSDFEIPPAQRVAYAACVHRGYEQGQFEYYPMPLRERLPVIRVPLRQQDPDAALDIQALVDQAYRDGGYDDLDCSREPVPPLNAEDAAWAAQVLAASGKR